MVKTFRSQQRLKDEQINYLLSDLEKSLEQYREAVELRDKQIADAKKILLSAKQSYDSLAQENRKLKEYVAKAQQENQLRQQQLLARNRARNYKKVVLEEESDKESDTESEQEWDIVEHTAKAQQVKKPRKKRQTANVFDYINNNNNAKRHKR